MEDYVLKYIFEYPFIVLHEYKQKRTKICYF